MMIPEIESAVMPERCIFGLLTRAYSGFRFIYGWILIIGIILINFTLQARSGKMVRAPAGMKSSC
jgi:hypothetical protein